MQQILYECTLYERSPENEALSAAMTRSQEATSWQPAAAASPATDASTGKRADCSCSISSVQRSNTCVCCSCGRPGACRTSNTMSALDVTEIRVYFKLYIICSSSLGVNVQSQRGRGPQRTLSPVRAGQPLARRSVLPSEALPIALRCNAATTRSYKKACTLE